MASDVTIWLAKGLLANFFSHSFNCLMALMAVFIMQSFLGVETRLTWKKATAFFVPIAVWIAYYSAIFIRWKLNLISVNRTNTYTTSVGLCFLIYFFLVYLWIYPAKRVVRAIWASLLQWVLSGYLTGIILITYLFGENNPEEFLVAARDIYSETYFRNMSLKFTVALLLTLFFYFAFYKKNVRLRFRKRDFAGFAVTLVLMFMAGSWVIIDVEDGRFPVFFKILFPGMCIVLPAFLLMMRSRKLLQNDNLYQKLYLDAELEYVKQYKRSQQETRAFRHDIVNQLSLCHAILQEGKTKEAETYLKELLGEVQKLSSKYVTGDEMLDCIVAMKAARMEEIGATFTLEGVVEGGFAIAPIDICTIFANALDNAIEAVASQEKREIFMSIRKTDRFYVIQIKNTAANTTDIDKLLDGSGYTSKKDRKRHGFGLQNIKRTVEKYEGMIKMGNEEGCFTLSIMLPREEKKFE